MLTSVIGKIRASWAIAFAAGLVLLPFTVGCMNSNSPHPAYGTLTTLTVTPNPAAAGATVTLTVAVSAVSGTPTGTVTFFDGATSLGTGTLSNGTASLAVTTFAAGVTHAVSATYAGSSAYAASLCSPITLTVTASATTVLTVSPNPASAGAPVTLTANVTASNGTPTGTVTFYNGTTSLGTGTLSGGLASLTVTTFAASSTNTLTATYGGSSTYGPSTSAAVVLTVAAPVATAIATITGIVSSGAQAISGATIGIWTPGSAGYGSANTSILNAGAMVTTAANGSYTITTSDYTCPSANTLVYLIASGGSPGLGANVNNSAIMLATPLGICGNLPASTTADINPVTTAAAAFALGQYFTTTFGNSGTDSFGTSNTTQGLVGLTNAFATVNNLVSISTGTAFTSNILTGTGSLGNITMTPESAKLNTIANILASCVNTTSLGSSACQTLFSDVTPTGATAPSDTLQAAVYMSLNPTSNNANGSATNLTALYTLQDSAPTYAGLGAAPTDWTLGIQYAGTFQVNMTQPQDIAVDASGNIWFDNNGGPSGELQDALTELSPSGVPLAFISSMNGDSGFDESNMKTVAVDLNGTVWYTAVAGGSGGLFEYVPSTQTSYSYPFAKTFEGIAVNANNDLFITAENTAAAGDVLEFPANATLSTDFSATGIPAYAYPFPSNITVNPESAAFDTNGNLWMDDLNLSSSYAEVVQLSNINSSACATDTSSVCTLSSSATANTYTAATAGSPLEPYGLAAGASGSMWVANGASSSISKFTTTAAGTNFTGGGLDAPRFIAVDGAGNVWVANNSAAGVSEFNSSGSALSPLASGGFAHSALVSGYGIGIDPSGNVWVTSNSSTTPAIEEIVGVAVPPVTPIAQALKSGASYPSRP